MKIKTITCHKVYNYGASLQAYALQRFLEKNGYDVELINYAPDYKRIRYRLFDLYKSGRIYELSKRVPCLAPLLALYKNYPEVIFWGRKNAFDVFDRKYLKLTSVFYRNVKELRNNPPVADCYIAGSDQIWNPYGGNGTDPSYYLDFIDDHSKCISYAASFGISEIPEGHKCFVEEKLRKFRAISVREMTGEEIVRNLGLNSSLVLDPVFLLDSSDWENLSHGRRSRPYLLVYDFLHDDSRIKQYAEKIAKHRNLDIVSINDFYKLSYAKNINDAGPIQFIELIKNADFVISSSFHATAFSVIFEKEFLTFPLKSQNNFSRMHDFLVMLDLESRFVSHEDELEIIPINYDLVNNKLNILKQTSKEWLLNNLSV